MRSLTRLPADLKMFPQYLREAGYYCTNNVKQDYNLTAPDGLWDESSKRAHWKKRRPDQPFFAVFNFTNTHESKIRNRPHKLVHDPSRVRLPAYHPDTPAVRRDWAQYYDNITAMDQKVAEKLAEIEEAGLSDETVVFFFGDHGSGMPRSKRCVKDSGLRVPMIVYVPESLQHLVPHDYMREGLSERLVSFVDLAPTMLSLAGIATPRTMQGHAFLGLHATPPQPYLFGFRGRMDERYDMVRSVTDGRFLYVRNYLPLFPAGQHVRYMFITPTTRVWKDLFDRGTLPTAQARFWEPRPAEELYDLRDDPDEVHNLADSPQHQDKLRQLRSVQRNWVLETRDLGFLPEMEIHSRARAEAPYTMGHDPHRYPLEQILAAAELAASPAAGQEAALRAMIVDADSAVRYWAALGLLMRGGAAVAGGRAELRAALEDSAPAVRIAAAWALGKHGSQQDLELAVPLLVQAASYPDRGVYSSLLALTALDHLEERAVGSLEQIKALSGEIRPADRRSGFGIPALLEKTIADLESR